MRKNIGCLLIIILLNACNTGQKKETPMLDEKDESLLKEEVQDHKIIVYQIFTRLFGNKKTTNKHYGTLEENGVGKFADIDANALREIHNMGITHVWYMGVIEHATMTDYTRFGIPLDDADVVKGRAGSPYAIKDYYDVNPDLAVDVPKRMQEFEALLERTHAQKMKVIIDFVPNHVARSYHSDAKPAGLKDLGETDDKNKSFAPNNNFYYLPGHSFVVPHDYRPLGDLPHPTKDGRFAEAPAKVTGNDQFTHAPGIHDWFETVKLNYGVDIQHGRSLHIDPIPDTWEKMRDILIFWAKKGVDGFRCDMAEMVPVEFWNWVIPQIKEVKPGIIFIAEIYNPAAYHDYIHKGQFTYLYDKVGLYDTLRHIVQGHANASDIQYNWKHTQGINNYMLRFLENHDEQRIASPDFAGDAKKALPAMVVTATLNSGPVMIYFGQEVGEPGRGNEGFSGEDGRTTIFDYWGVPEHQKWMSNGKFDGSYLEDWQREVRVYYSKLLNFCRDNEAIRKGGLYDLQAANTNGQTLGYDGRTVYSYIRFTDKQRLLVVVSFEPQNTKSLNLRIPLNAFAAMGLDINQQYTLKPLFGQHRQAAFSPTLVADIHNPQAGIPLQLAPLSAYIFSLEQE
jgi:glycosidase